MWREREIHFLQLLVWYGYIIKLKDNLIRFFSNMQKNTYPYLIHINKRFLGFVVLAGAKGSRG